MNMKSLMKWSLAGAAAFLACGNLPAQSPSPSASASPATKHAATASGAQADRFKRMDRNGDGFVTQDEARSQERFDRLKAKADANKDGKISQEEFAGARHHKSAAAASSRKASEDSVNETNGSNSKNAATRFKRMDRNNDGFVTQDEARNPERFNKLLQKTDTNKDGKISQEEFASPGAGGGNHAHHHAPAAASSPGAAASATVSPAPSGSPK